MCYKKFRNRHTGKFPIETVAIGCFTCVRRQGGDTEYPLAGLHIMLVLNDNSL